MIRIYGCSDDLVEIEGSKYKEREIDCFEKDVRIFFDDGSIIRIGYNKPGLAVWYIVLEAVGTAGCTFQACNDADAEIYSDIFETDAEIVMHELTSQAPPVNEWANE